MNTWHHDHLITARRHCYIRQLAENADLAALQDVSPHSFRRRLVVPDYRAATDRLAPGPETSDGPTPGL